MVPTQHNNRFLSNCPYQPPVKHNAKMSIIVKASAKSVFFTGPRSLYLMYNQPQTRTSAASTNNNAYRYFLANAFKSLCCRNHATSMPNEMASIRHGSNTYWGIQLLY